ncbi:MAG: 30S ribosomal protein S9 [Candidatus Aenigmarchaeota archaeon]|nr:30S ribosomal protein S9 [Candidatus Aenigmarchaeota archaeon]
MGKIFVGRRKRAVARVRVEKGERNIIVNHTPIENFPKIAQLKILEPLLIAGNENFKISANVRGGGIIGQAEAIAQGIAKGLVSLEGEELKRKFLNYDRNLLIPDVRRTEPHKPSRSKKGPRRHKQRSKR